MKNGFVKATSASPQCRFSMSDISPKHHGAITRSHTPPIPPTTCEENTETALSLRDRVGLSEVQLYRLVGVGLQNFQLAEDSEGTLFADADPSSPLPLE
jgi:hypothetical protein